MSESKHTPLPWIADCRLGVFAIYPESESHNCLSNLKDSAVVYQMGRGAESSPGCYRYLTEEQDANAAFIVEACNSHYELLRRNAELVEALKVMIMWHDEIRKPDIVGPFLPSPYIINDARALLEREKGERNEHD